MRGALVVLACLVVSLALSGCGSETEMESEGGSNVRELDFSGFKAVETRAGIEVKIVQSPTFKVSVFANPAMMEKVLVEVTDGTLTLGFRRSFFLPPWTLSRKVRVEISMPTLERLSASGGSPVDVAMDVAAGGVTASLSGGSRLSGSLTAATLSIEGSGGSAVTLTGSTTTLKLSGSGGSRFRMADYTAVSLDADLAGGSSVECEVSETLAVRASGGSHVLYSGEASVKEQDLSGGSWIRKD